MFQVKTSPPWHQQNLVMLSCVFLCTNYYIYYSKSSNSRKTSSSSLTSPAKSDTRRQQPSREVKVQRTDSSSSTPPTKNTTPVTGIPEPTEFQTTRSDKKRKASIHETNPDVVEYDEIYRKTPTRPSREAEEALRQKLQRQEAQIILNRVNIDDEDSEIEFPYLTASENESQTNSPVSDGKYEMAANEQNPAINANDGSGTSNDTVADPNAAPPVLSTTASTTANTTSAPTTTDQTLSAQNTLNTNTNVTTIYTSGVATTANTPQPAPSSGGPKRLFDPATIQGNSTYTPNDLYMSTQLSSYPQQWLEQQLKNLYLSTVALNKTNVTSQPAANTNPTGQNTAGGSKQPVKMNGGTTNYGPLGQRDQQPNAVQQNSLAAQPAVPQAGVCQSQFRDQNMNYTNQDTSQLIQHNQLLAKVLAEQIHKQQSNPTPPRLDPPGKFAGNENESFPNFRVNYENWRIRHDMSVEDASMHFPSRLTGDALRHVQNHLAPDATYHQMIEALENEFGFQRNKHKLRATFDECKQGQSQEGAKYIDRMYELWTKMYGKPPPEHMTDDFNKKVLDGLYIPEVRRNIRAAITNDLDYLDKPWEYTRLRKIIDKHEEDYYQEKQQALKKTVEREVQRRLAAAHQHDQRQLIPNTINAITPLESAPDSADILQQIETMDWTDLAQLDALHNQVQLLANNGNTIARGACFKCGEVGHYANECQNERKGNPPTSSYRPDYKQLRDIAPNQRRPTSAPPPAAHRSDVQHPNATNNPAITPQMFQDFTAQIMQLIQDMQKQNQALITMAQQSANPKPATGEQTKGKVVGFVGSDTEGEYYVRNHDLNL